MAAIAWWVTRPAPLPRAPVGLFTSLPIYWNESADLGDMLQTDAPTHWARQSLAQTGEIVPLDTLEALRPELKRLVMAQPRPLAPAENVALDNWVRAGGQVLLLADPMLLQDSAFMPGDPRRPQDIAMLSPILTRWGLTLNADADVGAPEPRLVRTDGIRLPVTFAGWWTSANPNCVVRKAAVLAECRVGKGRVVALADAEVAAAEDADGARREAFDGLLRLAFATR